MYYSDNETLDKKGNAMTTLYVVVQSLGGYAREDADRPGCAGVYTEKDIAAKVAKVSHGTVIPIELDHIHPGYLDMAKMCGMKL